MNRRKFLATLFGAGAAIAVGPALLALVPTPAPAGPMVITCDGWAAGEMLQVGDVFTISMLQDRYIRPAAQSLSDAIDADLIAHYRQFTVTAVVTSEAA